MKNKIKKKIYKRFCFSENNDWRIVECNNEDPLSIPPPTRNHSATVYSNSMTIFGGQNDWNGTTNALFEFHFDDNCWQKINLSNRPAKRRSHVSFVWQKKIIIFGGYNSKTLADMNSLDIFLRSWSPFSHFFFPSQFHSQGINFFIFLFIFFFYFFIYIFFIFLLFFIFFFYLFLFHFIITFLILF